MADKACSAEYHATGSTDRRLSPLWPLAGLALGQIGAGLPTAAHAHYRDQQALSNQQVTALFAFLILGVMLVLWSCWLGFAEVRRGPTLAAALVVATSPGTALLLELAGIVVGLLAVDLLEVGRRNSDG